jgi:hypothetical protein
LNEESPLPPVGIRHAQRLPPLIGRSGVFFHVGFQKELFEVFGTFGAEAVAIWLAAPIPHNN